jgi:hypothetical protein
MNYQFRPKSRYRLEHNRHCFRYVLCLQGPGYNLGEPEPVFPLLLHIVGIWANKIKEQARRTSADLRTGEAGKGRPGPLYTGPQKRGPNKALQEVRKKVLAQSLTQMIEETVGLLCDISPNHLSYNALHGSDTRHGRSDRNA